MVAATRGPAVAKNPKQFLAACVHRRGAVKRSLDYHVYAFPGEPVRFLLGRLWWRVRARKEGTRMKGDPQPAVSRSHLH
jgi:hypothetical protein